MNRNESFNVDLYSDLISKHGASLESLNWGKKESQILRFKILSEIDKLSNNSVLDVGCGIGDFWEWSSENGLQIDYKGMDITPSMISLASQRFPTVSFESASILDKNDINESSDFVIASGIFTYCLTDSYDFAKQMIKKMFDISRVGAAFNMLSDWADYKDVNEFYADPEKMIRVCKDISKWTTLRHDYHPGDFTIYLYKNKKR